MLLNVAAHNVSIRNVKVSKQERHITYSVTKHCLISEESRQTGFETSYVTPYSAISGAMPSKDNSRYIRWIARQWAL
jgi:hypothetical protein